LTFSILCLQLYTKLENFAADLFTGALQVRYDFLFREHVLLRWHTPQEVRFGYIMQRSELVMPSTAAAAVFKAKAARGTSQSGGSLAASEGSHSRDSSRAGSRSRSSSRDSWREGRDRDTEGPKGKNRKRSRGRSRGWGRGTSSSRSPVRGRSDGKQQHKERQAREDPRGTIPALAATNAEALVPTQSNLELNLPAGIEPAHLDELREAAVLLSFLRYAGISVDDYPSQAAALQHQLVPLEELKLPPGLQGEAGCSVEQVVRSSCGRVLLRCDDQGKANQMGSCVRLGVGYLQVVLQHQFLKKQKGQLVPLLQQKFKARYGRRTKHLVEGEYCALLQRQPCLELYQQVRRGL
jgi:hypothetical protein